MGSLPGPMVLLEVWRQRCMVSRMHLEDHLGDILSKARHMSGVGAAQAAEAAGLGEAEWEALESSGQVSRKLDWARAGQLLHLHPGKLQAISAGWLPGEVDLSMWRELRVITTSRGGMAVNCYVIWDEVSREAALFDTGWEAEPLIACIRENELVLRHIFITHSHVDHISALDDVRAEFPKARLHWSARTAAVDQRNRANDFIHLGSLRITNRDTPGHAEDGVTYLIGTWPEDAPHVAIVGDAIFAGSVGKGNVSWPLALQKVREQILSLPPDTLICPGHGPLTTVREEKDHNPFF